MPRLPRRDRAPVLSGADEETVEDVAAQSPAVGMAAWAIQPWTLVSCLSIRVTIFPSSGAVGE
jgi:hypothetical protein